MSITNPIDENVWVTINGGEFIMGSPEDEVDHEEDELQHLVQIESFSMMSHPVTFDQYDQYCDAQDLIKTADEGWGRGQRPVLFVKWFEAKKFAEWLTDHTGVVHRLPTEAEWEYACRAETACPFSFGYEVTTDDANFDGVHAYDDGETGSSRGKTLEVGQFEPNSLGLYDMHGNVWEWTASIYDAKYQGGELVCADDHSVGPRVVRGGSWYHFVNNIRSAYRGRGYPETSLNSFGFRFIREI